MCATITGHGNCYGDAMKHLIPLLLLASACSAPFRAEVMHPSPARMRELLDAPVIGAKIVKLPFELQVSSRFPMQGADTYVTCVVPERFGVGRIRYGIEGLQTYEGALDHTQNRLLVQNLPCGTLVATCAISTAKGIQRTADVEIDVKGGLCDGQ